MDAMKYSLLFVCILLNLNDHCHAEEKTKMMDEPPKPLTLECDAAKNDGANTKWFKSATLIPTNDTYKVNDDGSLLISKTNDKVVGLYNCENGQEIRVGRRPDVKKIKPVNYDLTERSLSIVEEETLEIVCEFDRRQGERSMKIGWYILREEPTSIDDPIKHEDLKPQSGEPNEEKPAVKNRIQIQLNETLKTISLKINSVEINDRAYYVCEADNGIVINRKWLLVRVRDKLDALWPFLGIVGEVLILCTIIFIYEKRRVKPDFDDSDTDHQTEGKSPQSSSKSQDVRQRK